MQKGNLDDLKNLGEDLKGCVDRHPDALRANPDLQIDLIKLRDKAQARYEQVAEKKPE